MIANSARARRPVNKRCDFSPLSTICHFHFLTFFLLSFIVAFRSEKNSFFSVFQSLQLSLPHVCYVS